MKISLNLSVCLLCHRKTCHWTLFVRQRVSLIPIDGFDSLVSPNNEKRQLFPEFILCRCFCVVRFFHQLKIRIAKLFRCIQIRRNITICLCNLFSCCCWFYILNVEWRWIGNSMFLIKSFDFYFVAGDSDTRLKISTKTSNYSNFKLFLILSIIQRWNWKKIIRERTKSFHWSGKRRKS